jgi:hypothetical protein
MRTRNTLLPSQKPQQRLSNPGPFKSTQISTFVYGFAQGLFARNVSSTLSQTCVAAPAALKLNTADQKTGISHFMDSILCQPKENVKLLSKTLNQAA